MAKDDIVAPRTRLIVDETRELTRVLKRNLMTQSAIDLHSTVHRRWLRFIKHSFGIIRLARLPVALFLADTISVKQ